MSKWLYLVAVISDRQLSASELIDDQGSLIGDPDSCRDRLFRLISDTVFSGDADQIVYFSSFMDGWARTHLECEFSPVAELGVNLCQKWKGFEESDVLCIRDAEHLSALSAWMGRVVSRPREPKPLNQYAIERLCRMISDGCNFATATDSTLFVACRFVGVTRDDREYTGSIQ